MTIYRKKTNIRSYFNYVCIFTLFLITISTTSAYTVHVQTWSSQSTTYAFDSTYSQYGGTSWINVANGAASDWNTPSTSFSFSQYSASGNLIKAGQTPKTNQLAVTFMAGNSSYRWNNFSTVVNTVNGFSFYDGTQTPYLPSNYYDLRSVLRHELGHALGLCHTWNASSALMYPYLAAGTLYTVDQDAINGSKYLYNPNYAYLPPDAPCGNEQETFVGYGAVYDDKPSYNLDTPGGVIYGNNNSWQHGTFPNGSGGTVSYTNIPGSKATVVFNGSRITRRYTMANNRGTAAIYMDGSLIDNTNDNAVLTRWQVAKTWTVPQGRHTFEVRNNGGGYIDADRFDADYPYNPSGNTDDNYLNYTTSWTSGNFSQAYNSTVHYSNVKESTFSFDFYGSQVQYYYTKAYNRGKAAITIDGIDKGYVDLYSGTTQWQQFTPFNVSLGYHTINVTVSGLTSGSDTYVDVDKMYVQ